MRNIEKIEKEIETLREKIDFDIVLCMKSDQNMEGLKLWVTLDAAGNVNYEYQIENTHANRLYFPVDCDDSSLEKEEFFEKFDQYMSETLEREKWSFFE